MSSVELGTPIYWPHVGDRVTCIFDGEITGYDHNLGRVFAKGNTRGAQHIEWQMHFHWGTEFYAPAVEWQRGDVVMDDSGNLFNRSSKGEWYGLPSNQTSSRDWHAEDELHGPLILLVRDGKPVT